MSSSSFLPIEEALEVFRQGHPIVAMDDENRENEGDLIMAAEFSTQEKLAFILRHTTGIICAPMLSETADELNLPPMVVNNEDPKCTAFTVSCDLIEGCSTGVSAHDRALTLKALAHPCRIPSRFHRPGHVFPLRAKPGGVLERRGHTEACVDLCRLAGVQPVGVIGELMDDEGCMMRFPACQEFAKQHGLHIITIEALAEYRRKHLDTPFPSPPSASFALSPAKPRHNAKDCLRWSAPASPIDTPASPIIPSTSTVELAAECVIPIERGGEFLGEWKQKVFVDRTGYQHIALVMGDVSTDSSKPVIARVHSECFTGDLLGSRRCDCGLQLDQSFRIIAKEGRGVIVYCGGHEGRGIGLISKIRAYKLQSDENLDTYEANCRLGFPADMRSYEAPLAVLKCLGIHSVELLTNNPLKVKSLQGIVTNVRPLRCSSNEHNERYLNDKHAFEQKVAKTMNGSLETMVAKLCENNGNNSCGDAAVAALSKQGGEITQNCGKTMQGSQNSSATVGGQRCLFREGSS